MKEIAEPHKTELNISPLVEEISIALRLFIQQFIAKEIFSPFKSFKQTDSTRALLPKTAESLQQLLLDPTQNTELDPIITRFAIFISFIFLRKLEI